MKSIRLKLWSWLMLLVVAVLVLLWLFQVVFLEQFYYSMHFNRIEDRAVELIESIEQDGSTEQAVGRDDVRLQIENLSESMNLGIEVQDINRESLYQYSIGSEPMFKRSLGEASLVALSGKIFKTTVAHMRFDSEFWVLAMPIFDQSDVVMGCIVITAPIEPVAETTNIIKQQLIYITGILLLLASAIAFGVSKQFSKPIVKISNAAKEIAKGNFDVKLDSDRQDEIGQLSKDISEMGQALGQIDRLRKELIGNISHELRTPLSIIRGYAETLRDVTGDNPEKRAKQLDIIINESERLGQLIEDVLNMSQLESGTAILDFTCFDIGETLNEICTRFDVVHNIKVITPQDKVDVKGDRKRIEQVLYNLIGNAIQHSDSSDPIELRLVLDEDLIKIEVVDHGLGIPEVEIAHIWDRFYQAKDESDGKPKGTGLGLAIVKAILENHHSKYGVVSKIDSGSTFWFTLPKC